MKKSLFISSIVILGTLFLVSCKKDQGLLPVIKFKSTALYVSHDTTLAAGSDFSIGIDASKAESADVLTQFNITKSVNGAASTTEFTKALTGTEGDSYSYDYFGTLENNSGQVNKYTFYVTNRDGLTNQVSVSITIQ